MFLAYAGVRCSIQKTKLFAAEVEVLRQSGYEDWQRYSRWNTSGIGDLYYFYREKMLNLYGKKLKQWFFKITNYLTPHGSFMSYSLITSVYSTITLVIELSDFAFIIWSIYFFLLVLNIITIRFSIYSDFFKSQQFIVSIIQLLDLGTDIAFLYKIGGISSNTIELYGIYTILFYFTSLIISYFSLLLLYYYSFNERKIRDYKKTKEEIIKKLNDINNNDLLSVDEDLMRKKTVLELKKENLEKKEILKKKQMWANTTLSIFGDIPLSLLTLIIDSKNECSDSITILSIVTSILTFFLSISGIIDSIQKKKYEYKYSI
mgnify:CR=1 FL=1